MSTDEYATLHIRMRDGDTTRARMAAVADALESLGAMLAEAPDVGGVETRDPTTLEGPQRPELVVYVAPDAVGEIEARARSLARALGLDVAFSTQLHEGDTWRERWKEFYAPRVLGAGTLLLRPSWIERGAADPTRMVVLDPGRAFGTGLHETTRLCLDRLVELFESGRRFDRVLDLGCGSGILALVAARLFEDAPVLAIDVDPEASETTLENVELNALGDRIRVETGTVTATPSEPFGLVIANIRAEVLVPEASAIAARVGDTLLLSGILHEEADEVARAYASLGLHERLRVELGDWTGLCFGRQE